MVWLFITFTLIVIVQTLALAYDNFTILNVLTFFTIVAFCIVYQDNVKEFFSENWLTAIYYFLTYLVFGIVWSVIKWYSYIKSLIANINEAFVRYKALKPESAKDWKNFRSYLKSDYSVNRKDLDFRNGYQRVTVEPMSELLDSILPNASENKTKIVNWMIYWPMSLLETLIRQPLRRLFNFIYDSIAGIFDKIVNYQKRKYASKSNGESI